MNAFRSFQISRAFSSLGDEMWISMLPIYLASIGFDAKSVGLIFSAGAAGNLFGFFLMPVFADKLKASKSALVVDGLQLVVFGFLTLVLIGGIHDLSLLNWMMIQFVLSFLEAVWYISSETLITRISDESTSQSTHRSNYFASSLGPAFGPALSGILYQVAGIVILAGFNAVSFVGQTFTLLLLSKQEPNIVPNVKKTFLSQLGSGLLKVWQDRRLRYQTVLPVVVKVFILGAIPFIAFRMATLQIPPLAVGFLLAAFAAGNALGAVLYKPSNPKEIAHLYLRDCSSLLASGVALNLLLLLWPKPYLLAIASLITGFYIARYSIELRVMRQAIVAPADMAAVISSQGLLARLATPLSGIMYGFLFSTSQIAYVFIAMGVFVLIGFIGVAKTYRSFLSGAKI